MLRFKGSLLRIRGSFKAKSLPLEISSTYLLVRRISIQSNEKKTINESLIGEKIQIIIDSSTTTCTAAATDINIDENIKVNLIEFTVKQNKLPLIEQIQALHNRNQHREVLIYWENLKKRNPKAMTSEIINLCVISAESLNQFNTVISIVDYAQSIHLPISSTVGLSYIKKTTEWSRAVSVLDTILDTNTPHNKEKSNRVRKSTIPIDILQECFETTLVLCARKGKNKCIYSSIIYI